MIEKGYCLSGRHNKFIEYFERCNSVGMSKSDIEKNIPFLQQYYCDATSADFNSSFWHTKFVNLEIVFKDWCETVNLK